MLLWKRHECKAIIAGTIEDLQSLINAMNEVGVHYGLVINIKKTELMVVSREKHEDATLQIDREQIRRVSSFKKHVRKIAYVETYHSQSENYT